MALRRRAGAARAATAVTASQTPPASIIARLISCAWVRPSATSSLRRMNSTRKRSVPARQVEREEDAGPEAVAQPPEDAGDEAHRQRLVDRRRVDGLVGRHGAVRIGHRPGPVPGLAVVAVAGELAADAADRVAERQRRRARGRAGRGRGSRATRPRAKTPIAPPIAPPYQTRPEPREEVAEQVVLDVVVVLDDEVEARADEPADQRREAHLVGPVDRLAELARAASRSARPAARKASAKQIPKVCRVSGPRWISGCIDGRLVERSNSPGGSRTRATRLKTSRANRYTTGPWQADLR